ncbi:MAG TPA: hypothetical protein VEB18_02975 [Candidatus Paceibacterota bacterium]|nr:hypothetical protein [Candidatus Paceibacterota bacterium]
MFLKRFLPKDAHTKEVERAVETISWMVSCELQEVQMLRKGFSEAKRIDSIFLSPLKWLAVANPAIFRLSQVINLGAHEEALAWAAADLRVLQKKIKQRNWRRMIEYLDARLKLMNERFDWATHREDGVTPQEAVQAKFETEREIRSCIAALKRQYEKDKGHPYQ